MIKPIFFSLLLLFGGAVAAEECQQGLLPGLDRCPASYRTFHKCVADGKPLRTMAADDYAQLWSNCFNYRDREGAHAIAIKIKQSSPFWSMLFERLAGRQVASVRALRAMRSTDVPSNQYALIFPMLFTPAEMRRNGSEFLAQVADSTEKELASSALTCNLEVGAEKPSKEPMRLDRGFGQKDYEALSPVKKTIIGDGLETGCLSAFTLSAFLSCHYDEAMEGYERIKQLVLALPPSSRGADSLGFNFGFYAYLAGKPLAAEEGDGWIMADGVKVPAYSKGAQATPSDAYRMECVRLLQMSAEKKRLGL